MRATAWFVIGVAGLAGDSNGLLVGGGLAVGDDSVVVLVASSVVWQMGPGAVVVLQAANTVAVRDASKPVRSRRRA